MGDVTNAAVIAADTAAGIAFAILISLVAGDYIDLANDYYHLYRDQRDFYYNNFQLSGEEPLTNELYGVPFYVPLYTTSGTWVQNGVITYSSLSYYRPQAAFQADTVYGTSFLNHLNMFNTLAQPLVPALFELSEISDDWATYFYRYEEHRRDVYNARRYAQNMDVLSYGVKEGAQVARGLATNFSVFDEAQGHLVGAMNASLDDIGTGIGYTKQLRELLEIPKATPDQIMRSNFDTAAGPSQ